MTALLSNKASIFGDISGEGRGEGREVEANCVSVEGVHRYSFWSHQSYCKYFRKFCQNLFGGYDINARFFVTPHDFFKLCCVFLRRFPLWGGGSVEVW